jgi:HEAT repeat protein
LSRKEKQMRQNRLLAGAGVLILVFLSVYGLRALLFGDRQPTAQELVEQCLGQGSDDERVRAAVALSRHPDASPEMLVLVAQEGRTDGVRAAAIQGLGQLRDVDSLPFLIDWMEDDALLVRGRAGVAADQVLGMRFGFKAGESAKQRARSIMAYRNFWAELQLPEGQDMLQRMRDAASKRNKKLN